MEKIKAIVYESNTGFTRQYAELLANRLKLPIYSLGEYSPMFSDRESIIFMGWVCAGKINGLRFAKLKYNIMLVVAVGMSLPSEETTRKVKLENNLDIPTFYIQGGLHRERLKGLYKLMMNTIARSTKNATIGRKDLSEEEKEALNLVINGGSRVRAENLDEVVAKAIEIDSEKEEE